MAPGPAFTAIAAVADNGVIGDGSGLLWRIPEDFARFKRVTMGGVLVMGRKTFDSLGGPLPGRVSIVVTRRGWPIPCEPCHPGGPCHPGESRDLAPCHPGESRDLTAAEDPGFRRDDKGSGMAKGYGTAEGSGTAEVDDSGTAVLTAPSPAAAVALLAQFPDRRWWCAGGGQIYAALWDHLTDLDITEVHQTPDAPVRFPAIDPAEWTETSRTPRDGFDFVTYTRTRPKLAQDEVSDTAAGACGGGGV
jgi:dihydrofolate reductase